MKKTGIVLSLGIFLLNDIPKSYGDHMNVYQTDSLLKDEIDFKQKKISVIGDTQKTLGFEKILLRRETNENETSKILEALSHEQTDLLIHLGDMIGNPLKQSHWDFFDRSMNLIVKQNIPVLPLLGNHEYFFGGMRKFFQITQRFTTLNQSKWFKKKYGPLLLIGLDTNRRYLNSVDWDQQMLFLSKALEEGDQEKTIKGIFVFGHHPAMTNSTCVSPNRFVMDEIKPKLKHSKKVLAYVSGHAHGYEHFIENQKHYIISAGGGGPRSPVLTGKKKRYLDHFNGPSLRPFNYLNFLVSEREVMVEVMGFQKNEDKIKKIDSIKMTYAE